MWFRAIQKRWSSTFGSRTVSKKVLRIGGVPEHFFYPWRRCEQKGTLEKQGLNVEFREYHGGSGAMTEALKSGELDVACMLTEAAVAERCKGAKIRMLGTYTGTSLVWGVYTSADHPAIYGGPQSRYAVSRLGSGSHLMALIDAQQRNVPKPRDFIIVNSLQGARDALRSDQADLFMWEKFTSKFLVDSGEWLCLAEVPTPWPSFCIAVTDGADIPSTLRALSVIREDAAALSANPDVAAIEIASEYNQKIADVKTWLATVAWCAQPHMPKSVISLVTDTLIDANILSSDQVLPYEDIIYPGVTLDRLPF